MVETSRIVGWLRRLIQIPSVGPDNAGARSGPSSEAQLAGKLVEWFTALGAEVQTEDVYPGRPNVYTLWNNGAACWIGLDVHMDTVGVETMQGDPFDGRVENGRIYGRGAVDTKASLAVALATLEMLKGSGKRLHANLLICASADEETGAHGAAVFADWVRRSAIQLDQLMVGEPTRCGPVYGHKGTVGLEFEIQGLAVHSSMPELGKNAIVAAAPVILALQAEHERLQNVPVTTELGKATLTVSMIHGGQGHNAVPEKCRLNVDRRAIPGEVPLDVANSTFEIVKQHCSLPVTMRIMHQLAAFYQNPDSPWIRQLAAWSGIPPTVVPYCTNAWAYSGLAREIVVLGPGSIDQAHRDVEWVEIAELEKLAGIYARWWGLV
jgi:acetylornithine deacetylase/succinyl-diaminopimelate desuccinylase-like protein